MPDFPANLPGHIPGEPTVRELSVGDVPSGHHDLGCRCWPHYSRSDLDAAAAAERERWRDALANLHRPFGIHDECDCKWDDEHGGIKHAGPTVVECGEFETCEPAWYWICRHCCLDGGDEQTELCVDTHDHGPGKPICETAALIAGLLGDPAAAGDQAANPNQDALISREEAQ